MTTQTPNERDQIVVPLIADPLAEALHFIADGGRVLLQVGADGAVGNRDAGATRLRVLPRRDVG